MTYLFPLRVVRAVLFVALALSLGLPACTSTPKADDDAQQTPTITVTAPEDLLQTEDTLLSMRMRFGGKLPAALRTIPTHETRFLAALLEDPVTTLLTQPGVEADLSALNTSRPLYINLSSLGNEDFLQAAALGLPIQEEELPAFLLSRVLLPTDDPGLMATQFEALFAGRNAENPDNPFISRAFEGPGFLRVELAIPIGKHRAPEADRRELASAWLKSLDLENLAPATSATFRRTAAYNAFVEGANELALWTRFESLARLAILDSSRHAEGHHDGEEGGQAARQRLESLGRLAIASVVNDPHAAENEDISLHLLATDEGAILVDAVTTRTQHGVHVRDSLATDLALPTLDTDAFLAVDWPLSIPSLAGVATAPLWKLEDLAEFSDASVAPSEFNARQISNGEGTLLGLLAAGQYPMAMLDLGWKSLAPSLPLPLPKAGTLQAYHRPQAKQHPMGAGAVLIFEDAPGVRDAIQSTLDTFFKDAPTPINAAFIEQADHIELRLSLGESINAQFADLDLQPLEETRIDFDSSKLGRQLHTYFPPHTFASIRRMSLATGSNDDAQILRLAINAQGEIQAPDYTSDAPLLPTPTSRCRTELAWAAFTHLDDLSVDASARVERYLETFRQRAERCIEPGDPYAAEVEARLNIAREWAAELDASEP